MTTARNTAAAIALAVLALPLVAFAFSGPTAQPLAGAKPSGDGCRGAYGWPIKPFDEAHPVRANFGDPRTRFDGGESSAGSAGRFWHLLVPSRRRHLGARRFARLCGRFGHGHTRAGGSCHGRLRKRPLDPVLAHRAHGARRTARRGRQDRARLHPAQARARASDSPGALSTGQPTRSGASRAVRGRHRAGAARGRSRVQRHARAGCRRCRRYACALGSRTMERIPGDACPVDLENRERGRHRRVDT